MRIDNSSVTESIITERLKDLYTFLPAIVQSYDSATKTCVARVAVSEKITETEFIEAANITDIPVIFPQGGNFRMRWSLSRGDMVMLAFSMRPLDEIYMASSPEPVVPLSFRNHSISDCVAYPGFQLRSAAAEETEYRDQFHMADEESFIVFNPDETDGIYINSDKDIHVDTTASATVDCSNLVATATTKASVVAPSIVLDGNVEITGNLTNKGNITNTGTIASTGGISSETDVSSGSVTLRTHTHPYIDSKGAAATPTPSTTSAPAGA